MTLSRWFFPSFNGDFRLESDPDDPDRTILTAGQLTSVEASSLVRFLDEARAHEWIDPDTDLTIHAETRLVLAAPVVEAGPVLAALVGYKTAGKLTVLRSTAGILSATEIAARGRYAGKEREKAIGQIDATAAAAVTVRRPTPCCPRSRERAHRDQRAEQVLAAILPAEEVDRWGRSRTLRVRGGLSGHQYRIHGRDTRDAMVQGRICFDETDNQIMHFHDSMVPVAEEALASWLILRFREPWLRNEATALGLGRGSVYKNPFGDVFDGIPDTTLLRGLGGFVLGFGAGRRGFRFRSGRR